MRPLVARFIHLTNQNADSAAAVRSQRPNTTTTATTSPMPSAAVDPFLQYEFMTVVGVQGEGYFLDCVIQSCSWLDKRSTTILNNVTHAMLEDRVIPVRWTVDDVTGAQVSVTPHHVGSRTVGNELRHSAAPYCNGAGAYSFLLDLFVLKAGRAGSASHDDTSPPSEVTQQASLGLLAAAATTPSLMSSMEKNPFFSKWGHKFLIPILSSMIDLVGSSFSSAAAPPPANIKAATSRLLQVFPPELMDHILQIMSPQDIPPEALATAAPLLLYRSIRSVSDGVHAAPHLIPQPTTDLPAPCRVPLKTQQDFARAVVDRCFDSGLKFHATLAELLRTQLVQDHRRYTWAVSMSTPNEGTGSFFRRLMMCFPLSSSIKVGDILPRDVTWIAPDSTSNGVRKCTFRLPTALIPVGWNGVAVVLRLYEMARPPTRMPQANSRPPWEHLLLSQLFAAEAFVQSAPPALACDSSLFNLIMSYCCWA
jgi:hypothetical protein